MKKCVLDSDIDCTGPPDGERFWVCSVHGAQLTAHWTALCRTKPNYRQAWLAGHGPGQEAKTAPPNPTPPPRPRKYLGDHIGDALAAVGITEDRVSKWLGRGCGCGKRKEQLNRLHQWVERKIKGLFNSDDEAKKTAEEILRK